MTERPVLQKKDVRYRSVTRAELDQALAHARISRSETRFKKGKRVGQIKGKTYHGQELSRDLLRIIANTALEQWYADRKVKLALLAAHVARDAIPSFKSDDHAETHNRYEGYKRAVMKVMSVRRVWQMKGDAERIALGQPIPVRVKQTEPIEDDRKKFAGQFRLFS